MGGVGVGWVFFKFCEVGVYVVGKVLEYGWVNFLIVWIGSWDLNGVLGGVMGGIG